MDNKTKMLLLLPPVFILVCIIAATSIPFDQSLTESESQILDFSSSELNISNKQKKRIATYMQGPFNFSSRSDQKPKDKVSDIDYNDNSLTLTVIGDSDRMAIINGEIVKEGDILDGMKIQRIETERVLIKNKNAGWLYLEKRQ
jgi:uncharacterized protein YjiK